MAEEKPLGKTGKYPKGKLDAEDEGELRLALGERAGQVVIAFGTPVAWLAMDPQEAANFGALVLKHARQAAEKQGLLLVVNLQ